ncbi:MAG: class I SAM-dependent methyltransferase [Acidobacteriia bacterium]|nr:class I SAM-dependent methyltransferase [Terriglobia bacterium]
MPTDPLHARDWEEMAAIDPLWAIMSEPEKRFGNWDINEFLRTGQEEISGLMQSAGDLALPRQRRRAIDFGCGVGRLTRALHDYFSECFGVDISSSMLQKARQIVPECEFREGDNLRSFPAGFADLIYSSLVLQHQPDKTHVYALIQDMVRVLAPGGLLVFQLPLHLALRNRIQLRRRAYRLVRAIGLSHTYAYERLKLSPIRMLALPQPTVEDAVRAANGKVVRVAVEKKINEPFSSGIYYCTPIA